MINKEYTSIPPVTDLDYWELKSSDGNTWVYGPKDRELHRQLKLKFRNENPVKDEAKKWR